MQTCPMVWRPGTFKQTGYVMPKNYQEQYRSAARRTTYHSNLPISDDYFLKWWNNKPVIIIYL